MHRKLEFWIITSTEDVASMNIRTHLLENYSFHPVIGNSDEWSRWEGHPTHILEETKFDYATIRLVLTDTAMVLLGDKISKKDRVNFTGADFAIFASRHSAKSSIPALLIHSTGNWSEDTAFGGEPHSLCRTSAKLVQIGYQNLEQQKFIHNLDWPVDLEVNHHGPTQFSFPLVFMELGSSEENWKNKIGGRAVADAIIKTILNYLAGISLDLAHLRENFTRMELYAHIKENEQPKEEHAIGFGGVHYARNFSKLLDRIPISFIVPKYFVPYLTEGLIQQMVDNTLEIVNYAIIDWSSMKSAVRTELTQKLDKLSISWKKRKDVSVK
ncbi:MAG: hypothetical protein JW776_09775 [Candidatus Lokiarchaeota archaeon]|nr:hypothetical protein [Candidatus Lokiarchaeota archaeon]